MLIATIILLLLGFAAWRDLATRTIPDAVSLGILLAGIAARCPEGATALVTSAAAALLLFAGLLILHHCSALGGGDVKLLTALAFGLSPFASYQMFIAVIFAGGILGLAYIALRRLSAHWTPSCAAALRSRSVVRRVAAVEFWRIRKGAPLPYGLAIAVGATFVIGHQGV
jgi:prepilin peptidase CpaA